MRIWHFFSRGIEEPFCALDLRGNQGRHCPRKIAFSITFFLGQKKTDKTGLLDYGDEKNESIQKWIRHKAQFSFNFLFKAQG